MSQTPRQQWQADGLAIPPGPADSSFTSPLPRYSFEPHQPPPGRPAIPPVPSILRDDVKAVLKQLECDSPTPLSPYKPASDNLVKKSNSSLDLLSPPRVPRKGKAAQLLGITHRKSMEPIPAGVRSSFVSTHSAPAEPPQDRPHTPSMPLTSLYIVSGLPKSPQTWTLADADAVQGLTHNDGAVNRWWRAEVLGSTVSPGVGGGKKKKSIRGRTEILKGAGALTKPETAKMLSKALKLSFTREVEIIASTLQPASTVHTFTFTLPVASAPLAPPSTLGLPNYRTSILSTSTENNRFSHALSTYGAYPYPYADQRARPSSAYLGPATVAGHTPAPRPDLGGAGSEARGSDSVAYHGVCLTVWSHADAERTTAIRRALESRMRKESAPSLVTSRIKSLRSDIGANDPAIQARKTLGRNRRGPWNATDVETEGDSDIEGDGGAVSESDVASAIGHTPGESTLFLPGDTVFWLPYALTLVSRYPIYDLMRDYLTLSWARFSKDVASHTLQISKILSHPAPRAGDIIRLDASAQEGGEKGDASLEVVTRFPGGLDFGRGLVDINFTMWPLFKCLNIDNILTICEIALAPTGRILFFSRHPALLGIAVATIKYIVELRGWNGIALPAVHSRDAKIYVEDPGPWIIGLAAEMRYSVRPSQEVCMCDLDINYLNCPSPPPGCLSFKQQRDRYRQKLLAAFGEFYHPDHSVPIEFKEAFPAGRFRPICKVQAKRGASSSIVTESIKAPEWWHSTRVIQAFDAVLQDKSKKPSLFKRISSFRSYKRPVQLSAAEQQVQRSIRKRATAFVDARDDLETKIGRLSRRLNFLMTESDLWREKFVTFEQYAETLSNEANELRSRITKEQKESKRLTGLISLTADEKLKVQNQLQETETAHKDAIAELERMRADMEKMEEERVQMIAEVEAQIEKALASMAVDLEDSDYGSRPGSSLSERSRSRSRPSSRRSSGAVQPRPTGSFSTESTLAEPCEDTPFHINDAIAEEEDPSPSTGSKRLSTTQDVMNAVDEGINDNSDRIAQKVLQIQQTLEGALCTGIVQNSQLDGSHDGDIEDSQRDHDGIGAESMIVFAGPADLPRNGTCRSRSSTTSSSQATAQTGGSAASRWTLTPWQGKELTAADSKPPPQLKNITAGASPSISSPSPAMSASSTTSSIPPTPEGVVGSVDDSDTDFQSAYSTSPRDSYCSFEGVELHDGFSEENEGAKIRPTGDGFSFNKHLAMEIGKTDSFTHMRERVPSNATATAGTYLRN